MKNIQLYQTQRWISGICSQLWPRTMQNSISQKKLEKVINFRDHMKKEWYRPPIRIPGVKRVSMQSVPKEWSCIRTLKKCSRPWESISPPPIHRHECLSSDGIISGTNSFFQCLCWLPLFYLKKEMVLWKHLSKSLIFHGTFQFSLEQQKTIGNYRLISKLRKKNKDWCLAEF